jgi:hypothetical protein
MGPPWWAWVIGMAVAAGVGLNRAVAHQHRAQLIEFVGHLRRLRPEVEILRHDSGGLGGGAWVAVRLPSGAEVTVDLGRLLVELARSREGTQERLEVMERWVKAVDGAGE